MPRAPKRQCYQTTQPLKLSFELGEVHKSDYLAANQPLEVLSAIDANESTTTVNAKVPGLTPIFRVELTDLKSTATPINVKTFDQIRVNVEALQRVTGDFDRFETLPF
ncbi:hypothetical protein [Companilactobacillus sp.]|uniref:hypothetical protein n=1 Tax=Companilactobacillus sp. TaxID=2767905 RepID=UPI002623A29B|nr:hypothetical protein [Companilactobacillus sp.]